MWTFKVVPLWLPGLTFQLTKAEHVLVGNTSAQKWHRRRRFKMGIVHSNSWYRICFGVNIRWTQGWGEYLTYEYEYWKISTRVVLEYIVFSIFMFTILDKTSTRVVLAPALGEHLSYQTTKLWKFHLCLVAMFVLGPMTSLTARVIVTEPSIDQ